MDTYLYTSASLSWLASLSIGLTLTFAVLLDKILGEPIRYHPLVGFGFLASMFEKQFNTCSTKSKKSGIDYLNALKGFIGCCVLIIPLPFLYYLAAQNLNWIAHMVLDGVIVYLAIGHRSLNEHAVRVCEQLALNNLEQARKEVSFIVSRQSNQLTSNQISRATVESVLENGHDAVIASLVYYLLGGAPLVIAHRLINTLDAMWGYKNSRFISFGLCAARLDDIFGFVSGKCCTLLYALQRPIFQSLANAWHQGNLYKSHNGGWVMAAGATVIGRTLGGASNYDGETKHSPSLGSGPDVTAPDIVRSLSVVKRATWTLLGSVICVQIIIFMSLHN